MKKIWAFEVMSFEDKVEVDGQTITGKIPVTLGMLLRALLFFVIGYWIASQHRQPHPSAPSSPAATSRKPRPGRCATGR